MKGTRTLALCFHSWRVFLAEAAFLRQEEAALVVSLWRAATSGLLDATQGMVSIESGRV